MRNIRDLFLNLEKFVECGMMVTEWLAFGLILISDRYVTVTNGSNWMLSKSVCYIFSNTNQHKQLIIIIVVIV